jgi:hypothetical protein
VASAACGAYDDFHADVVAINVADDAFATDIVVFFHNHFFVWVSPHSAVFSEAGQAGSSLH